jgi:DNA-binding MarR family transcriptional regulator
MLLSIAHRKFVLPPQYSPYLRLIVFSGIGAAKSIRKTTPSWVTNEIEPYPPLDLYSYVSNGVSINTVNDAPNSMNPGFSLANYRQLAELRFRIRQYLQFSEHVARTNGIEPQQHQLMLTIKGLPANTVPTVSALANRLCLRHHSTVELINRLVERGAAVRKPCIEDRRQVLVELTPEGEELLAKLNTYHKEELQTFAPGLLAQITAIMSAPASSGSDDPSSSQANGSSHPVHEASESADSKSFGSEKLESAAANLS